MPHTKTIVAGFGAAAALTGASLMFKAPPAGVDLFDYGHLSAEDYKFMDFVSDYGRTYGTKSEFNFRKEQFVSRHREIEAFNADTNNTHILGHNMFSDRTYDEMKKLNGLFVSDSKKEPTILDASNNADSVDWRNHGGHNAVTPVKNQGSCGSCWSFSTTGAIEGANSITSGVLKSYSEQQLVSCSTQNKACNGGLVDWAFNYVETNPLELEVDYQYVSGAGKDPVCSYDKSKGVGSVTAGWSIVPQYGIVQMKAALNLQPVSVGIQADQTAFQSYKSGVITTGCGEQIDHAVLAVGYGTLDGQEFFLVKNSWTTNWGDQGYVRIAPTSCGILLQGVYPNLF